jgi:hypothetical protein
MAEVPITALEPRQQKMVENARVALERANFDYVIEVTTQVLKASPGCLPVRRLQRVAQLRQARAVKGGFMAKVSSGLSTAPFMFGGGRKDPARLLVAAEASLARDPTNVVALKLLAEAAQGLGLRETAAFALDAVREIEPANRANLLALGEAWFTAGCMADALKTADEILRLDPVSPEAQTLMRKASVAQTVAKVGWEKTGTFREKLRTEPAASAASAGTLPHSAATTRNALAEALAAADREPQNLNHYRTVAQVYRQLGNLDAALEWVRKARQQPVGRTDPTLEKHESELATAVLEQRAGMAGAAAAAAPGAAALQAQAATARDELAAFKLAEARRAVERYPNDAAARYSLGALLLEAGEIDGAIAQFQQAQKGAPVRIASLVGLGRCFKAKRLYDLAVVQLGAARAELGPMDDLKKEITYELGLCYESLGRPDAAIVEFKAVYGEDIGFRDVAEKINAFFAR